MGVDDLTFAGGPETIGPEGDLSRLDAALERLPDCAAVFLVWPREGPPYLARTSLLRRRLRRLLRAREGAGRLLNLRAVVSRIDYWKVGSRLEASLLFYELALRYFPETYLRLTKLRMPSYVKVTLANAFPRTVVTTRLSGGRSVCYGPFRTRGAAEHFQAQILDLFQVRRCQEDLAPSPEHPGCMYGEMNLCLRPCQQAVSPEEYRSEVERVVAFFETGGRSLIEPLSAARERLSEELQFEEAARVHSQVEKIEQVLRLRDELVRETGRLHGVAVTASVEPGAVVLWFVLGGGWLAPLRFGFEAAQGRTESLDRRLRELVSGLTRPKLSLRERQEHLALLARWYYSSWRDGNWIAFEDPERVSYRRLVRAVSRVAGPSRNE